MDIEKNLIEVINLRFGTKYEKFETVGTEAHLTVTKTPGVGYADNIKRVQQELNRKLNTCRAEVEDRTSEFVIKLV